MIETGPITRHLMAEVDRILPGPWRTASEQLARQRLEMTAEATAPLTLALAEPWLARPLAPKIMESVALLHLYARALDDAVDNALPVNRRALLRCQPFFFGAVARLGEACGPLIPNAMELIAETVAASERDEQWSRPNTWGAKNHHLLLAPLLLSGNHPLYQEHRESLSRALCLLQAGEEFAQGAGDLLNALLRRLQSAPGEDWIINLERNGWPALAARAWRAMRLLVPPSRTVMDLEE